MQSLFSQDVKNEYLGVIYNDEQFSGEVEKLFEPDKFDTIQICTFVSSPKYFFKQTAEFKNIELLLGIEDNENAQKFMFDTNYTNTFFTSLSKETLQKRGC